MTFASQWNSLPGSSRVSQPWCSRWLDHFGTSGRLVVPMLRTRGGSLAMRLGVCERTGGHRLNGVVDITLRKWVPASAMSGRSGRCDGG
jgi:hypothetical protein